MAIHRIINLKQLFHLTILNIILFIFSSCSDKEIKQSEYKIDIDVTKEDLGFTFSKIIDYDYQFIKLETNDTCLIGRISKVLFIDSTIYILDSHISKSLFKFNLNGDFISIIGENGEGPGGYTYPTDFIVDKNTGHIIILDLGVRILEYDENENYLKTTDLADKDYSATLFAKTPNGFALISGGREDNLIITDNNFTKKNSFFPFLNRNLNKLLIHPLQSIDNNLVIYRNFLNDTIFKINGEVLNPHLVLNFGNNYSSDLFSTTITKEKFIKILKYGNSCLLKFYYENIESAAFAFSCNKKVYLGFYSKISNDLFLSPLNKFVNDITFEKKSSYIIGTTENSFIFYVQPQNLIEGVESNKKNYSDDLQFKKAFELSRQISDISNPVLLIARLKTN